MATKNKVNISSDIVAEIKSGNSDTTAAGLRTVLYEILDSYVNVKDGGLVYETEVGYNGLLTLTDQKSFVYKKWVENYVDNLITGLNWKKSVLYSTNSGEDLSLTGLTAAIDGSLRFLSPTDRILVKNQSTQSLNGIYNPSSGAWTRVVDADSDSEILAATVYVREGSVEKDRVYAVNVSPITLGTTAITFALISGAGAYTYGSYLKLTGNVFDIDFTTFSTNQISDYTNKRYQTENQKLFNDATSSIQGQLNEIRSGRKYFAYDNTTYSYTGTTASTILRTIYIPANSMNLNSTLELHAIFGKSGTAGTMNYAAYITTNPSVITGGSFVKINAFAAGNLQGGFVLRLTNKNSLNSQAVQLANSGANQYDSWQLANFARTLLSIDFAVDQYLHIYSTLGNATDTAIIYDYQCYIDKN